MPLSVISMSLLSADMVMLTALSRSASRPAAAFSAVLTAAAIVSVLSFVFQVTLF